MKHDSKRLPPLQNTIYPRKKRKNGVNMYEVCALTIRFTRYGKLCNTSADDQLPF